MAGQIGNNKSSVLCEPAVLNEISDSHKEDIVISGISGRLPQSANMEEFKKNLLEGIDCLTEDASRWPPGIYGLPTKIGTIKDISSFDANFFGVHHKQADTMDPQIRMLLEITQEVIVDAGFNPVTLRGSNTAVFVGISTAEAEHVWTNDVDMTTGYGLTGCCQAMFPNRISYTFDFRGPSCAIDTACTSSLFAMHQAVTAMRNGECDAAIVGGVNLLLQPTGSLHFHKLNMLSKDSKCKSFDADGTGYARSDAAVGIFLQKLKDARRVYATVVKTKMNSDGHKDAGIMRLNGETQYGLMREVYDESGINPADISYVEAHGIGEKESDGEEMNAVANIFCKDRKEPLLVGSVKSNMGHSEAASGLCAIAKVVIAMENGVIPPNLHYKTPNPNIPGLMDGRLKVVDKITPWNGGLVAVNNCGIGGTNAHVILRSNPKPKVLREPRSTLPKLVTISGRTKEAVDCVLDATRNNEQDDEFIALLRDIYADNIPGHMIRGFEILDNPDTRQIEDLSGLKRPVWFIFSGMGSQWEGMGRHLMRIDTFRRSLERCAAALKPVGIDLMDLILHGTDETYSNISNCFVSIAAIQVGLVDLLTFLDIHPDGIVGHSFGELGCAYADGTLTAEQIVLAAFWRGKSVLDSDSPSGAMAAVGLTWEEATKRCPPGVYPVCHNSADSVTISGTIEATHNFVKDLQAENIFAKVVNSSDYAFHSKYIASAGPILREALEKIIPNPKKRSSKWISSSVPESEWGSPLAQLSSAEYHVNNLLSPVLFHGATTHIPGNVIAIEIGPHCLLQAILRRSLSSDVTNIGLQKRNHKDNLEYFLSSMGKLYTAGGQLKISNLYPPANYPVGRGTPMISSLVKWDHSMKWCLPSFSNVAHNADTSVDVDLDKERDAYISGYKIDGRILYPATGYIMMIWKIFSTMNNTEYKKLPVVFENVRFRRLVTIPPKGSVKFFLNVFRGSGEFEIYEGGSNVVTGRVRRFEDMEENQLDLSPFTRNKVTELIELSSEDIYTELALRGYDYSGSFRGIKRADSQGITGEIYWFGNWVSFMDSMVQFHLLDCGKKELYLLTGLQYLSIDPSSHMKLASECSTEDGTFPIYGYKNIKILKSGGVEMRHLKVSLMPKGQQTHAPPKFERHTFVPYDNNHIIVEDPVKARLHSLNVLLQIVCENVLDSKLKVAEVAGGRPSEALLTPRVQDILSSEPTARMVDLELLTTAPDDYITAFNEFSVKITTCDINKALVGQNFHLILATDMLSSRCTKHLENLSIALKKGGFIISEETSVYDKNLLNGTNLEHVARQVNSGAVYVLLKKIEERKEPIVVHVTQQNFSWIEDVKVALKKAKTKDREILLVNQGEEMFGMVGFMNCLRLETVGIDTRYVFIQDKNVSKLSLSTPFYAEQLNKQMVANVLKDGQWGSYRHLRLDLRNDVPSLRAKEAFVNILVPGDLSSLRWIESSLNFYQYEKSPEKKICSVYYASLNHRDIMLATGKLPLNAMPSNVTSLDRILGIEFSGRDASGRKVMGMVETRGLATTVLADSSFVWEVPDKWTMRDAATIPVAYTMSYYALLICGRLRQGETVLIHTGSGGIGLASIAISLHAGCKVFTTVGSHEKRYFLKKMFPQLTDSNIGYSRDTSFEQLIMNETNGRGVDVILNSLSGEKLQASVRCLAANGRFLDIGKFGSTINKHLGMTVFLKNTTCHVISMDSLFKSNSRNKKKLLRLIKDGIESGVVRPLPAKVFTEQQISQAFTYMAMGKHIGKVLLKIREDEEEKVVLQPSPKSLMAVPRTYMNPNRSYILIGGLSRFGVEFANWMIERGAKHIVLISRFGIRTGYQSLCVRRWREAGVNVVIYTIDCSTLAAVEQLIKESNQIAPVGGIFNMAAVLNDGLIENFNEDNFKTVALPKIDVTKHLDDVSRKHCSYLDYFVVFSSIASGKGKIGQTNYGLANSAVERIVEQRKSSGLPGLAIQWGSLGDAGFTPETMKDNGSEMRGITSQRMSSCLSTMDMLLQQLHPIVCSTF